MKDIASTSVERARLAKYKDSIASAMQAQFSNILHEVSFLCANDVPPIHNWSLSSACFSVRLVSVWKFFFFGSSV